MQGVDGTAREVVVVVVVVVCVIDAVSVTGACVTRVLEEVEIAGDCDRIEGEGVVELKVTNDGVKTRALKDVAACVLKELEVSDRGRITPVEVLVSALEVDCTERLLRLDGDTCSVENDAELSEEEEPVNEDVASVDAIVVNAGPGEELWTFVDERGCIVGCVEES